MALLIVPRGPVIGLEANTLQPTKSLNQVQSPCQVSQQEHVKGLLLTFDQIHLKSLPWDSENHHLKSVWNASYLGTSIRYMYLSQRLLLMSSGSSQVDGFKTKHRRGPWWQEEIPSHLPAVLEYQLFRVEALSYTSAQVQNPTGGRHLVNVFLPGQVNKTDLFTELAQQSSNKQAVYHLEDPSLLCFPSYPW